MKEHEQSLVIMYTSSTNPYSQGIPKIGLTSNNRCGGAAQNLKFFSQKLHVFFLKMCEKTGNLFLYYY